MFDKKDNQGLSKALEGISLPPPPPPLSPSLSLSLFILIRKVKAFLCCCCCDIIKLRLLFWDCFGLCLRSCSCEVRSESLTWIQWDLLTVLFLLNRAHLHFLFITTDYSRNALLSVHAADLFHFSSFWHILFQRCVCNKRLFNDCVMWQGGAIPNMVISAKHIYEQRLNWRAVRITKCRVCVCVCIMWITACDWFLGKGTKPKALVFLFFCDWNLNLEPAHAALLLLLSAVLRFYFNLCFLPVSVKKLCFV